MRVLVQFVLTSTVDKIWGVEFKNNCPSFSIGEKVEWMDSNYRITDVVHQIDKKPDDVYHIQVWIEEE